MPDAKKPEEDEVTEEQLEEVAGGATAGTVQQDISLTKPVDKASAPLAEFVSDGSPNDAIGLHLTGTTDDDD